MILEYSSRAETDLDAIFEYLDQRNPRAAAAVLKTIRERVSELKEQPLIGTPTRRRGIRCLTITRYPYKAYYSVHDETISIAHIRDSRRAPWTGPR
jgi:addiction module RelE/StbE family toxin